MTRRKTAIWLGLALGTAIVIGLVVYLYSIGLDRADKLGSAIAAVIAVIALLGSLVSWLLRRSASPEVPAREPIGTASSASRRSAYLEEVGAFRPPVLRDREPELAQLAAFCADDASSYWRWVAGAWSGKTALLAWFVLHPPENVDVVAFFITSRFNPHHNREAFIEAVVEQVDALIGVPSSYGDQGQVRTRHLQSRLAEAARLSRGRGRRLVLVVDGLDEDRGLVVDSETYTIAALLPANPEPGLKVIVAGRPNPGLPPELGENHPLRQAANVHRLTTSPHARTNEATAQLELGRLLRDPAGRPVLGFLVAALGGLTAADLAALTGRPKYDVEQLLRSSVGRTFVTRPGRLRGGPEYDNYGLAHDELQSATLHSLDAAELLAYQQSIVDWAGAMAAAGWPDETAEYLLFGYPGFLAGLDDVDGLVRLALDTTRHDWMRAATGGDHANLLELEAVSARLLADSPPDLGLLARLAFHREQIEARTSEFPSGLPALWAKLGFAGKAIAMAGGISIPGSRERAIEAIGWELAAQRDVPGLERLLRTATKPDQLLVAAAALLDDARANDQPEGIERLLKQVLELLPLAQTVEAVTAAAGALTRLGGRHAEEVQRLLDNPYLATASLIARSQAAGEAGADQAADRLARRAEESLAALSGPERSEAILLLAATPALGADPDRRNALLDGEIPLDPLAGSAVEQVRRLTDAVVWQHRAGRPETATRVAERALAALRGVPLFTDDWSSQFKVCSALGLVGQAELALATIEELRTRYDPDDADELAQQLRVALLRGLAEGGHDESVAVVLERSPDTIRDGALAELAVAMADRGAVDRARFLLEQIEVPVDRIEALAAMAAALVVDRDEDAVLAIVDEGIGLAAGTLENFLDLLLWQTQVSPAVVKLAGAAADAGRPEHAAELATWVESRAEGRDFPNSSAVEALAVGLVTIGDITRAVQLVDAVAPLYQTELRRRLVSALLSQGDDAEAEALARRAEEAGDVLALVDVVRYRGVAGAALAEELVQPLTTGEPVHFDEAHHRVRALLALGESDRLAAERLAERLDDHLARESVLVLLCLDALEAGDEESVQRLFGNVSRPSDRIRILVEQSARPGERAAELLDQAESALAMIAQPADRVWPVLTIAGASARAGFAHRAHVHFEEAKAAADQVADPEDRDDALKLVADQLLLGQDVDEALLLVDQMTTRWVRESTLAAVAKALASAGDLRRALEVADAAPSVTGRAAAFAVLAEVLVGTGDYRTATAVGERTIDDPESFEKFLRTVVPAAVRAGDLSFAETTLAKAIDESTSRRVQAAYDWKGVQIAAAEGWCDIAAAAADGTRQRCISRALAIADELEMPEDRAVVLLRCAAVVPEPEARRLVGRAFASGPWHLPMTELAQYEPAALAELADVVLELNIGRAFVF